MNSEYIRVMWQVGKLGWNKEPDAATLITKNDVSNPNLQTAPYTCAECSINIAPLLEALLYDNKSCDVKIINQELNRVEWFLAMGILTQWWVWFYCEILVITNNNSFNDKN